ncbi:cupin domain-containing protein [Starkeya sp. ORNL1]|uniref:(R)-mandelonitrile lyase n=1 Tax=Starkeya sp. ORNL1 TaxID=2709380 RepID=UPI001463F917|nr:carboxymuconolactone decarboxylase family protein [Starkeya sp. ORNL1]QJP13125.1 cupin domain-containing protein [Starkeya sp. ORNL1]
MKLPAAMAAVISLAVPAEAEQAGAPRRVAPAIVYEVAPALGAYTDEVLFGDVWKRTELAPRDRSMVTIAALIAGGHTAQMTGHFNRALDNGVKPGEIAGTITHLAFYAGWPRAMSAVGVAKDVFTQRGIGAEQLAAQSSERIPVDDASEAQRAAAVEAQAGAVAPALARYTNVVLFGDLWRRADLAPRDRSLVTITALIAAGQVDQLAFHMNRGMDNGLSQTQLSEVITHLAFYAGWPRAMSALPVAKTVFETRAGRQDVAPASGTRGRTAMEILRHGSQPPSDGPADYFTGRVRIEQRFQRNDPARIGGAFVSFEPGARTAWHTHPLGQTLIVTSGTGWVQREGEDIQEIRVGDIVWIPPGEKHWHGATATSAMTHIAIAEARDGKSVDWMEQVSDEQYGR